MTEQKKLTICDTTIFPGESANLALPLPEYLSCSPQYMPFKVLHGNKPGPCLIIFSVVDGKELNGLEICNRLVEQIQPEEISGTLISIPVMNIYALTHQTTSLPSGQSLRQCFPGQTNGSFGQRWAKIMTKELFEKADYCIELQTGDLNHNILPQVYCDFDNERARQLAKVFRSPLVTQVTLENNSLRQTTEKLGIPLLVYQAGEAMRFDENAIELGTQGVKNIMKSIDMLPPEPIVEFKPIFSKDEEWIVAPKAGILHTKISLGQKIEKGELIGEISDPFISSLEEKIYSPFKGIVVGVNTSPMIHEGLKIFKVASFFDYNKAETALEQWDQHQPDSYMNT